MTDSDLETPPPVLAATRWKSNAELIEDLVKLRYLRKEWLTLDPTYGRGTWWKKWRPDHLVMHDINLDGVDFTNLPEATGTYDAVAFDPPYVCAGGRTTTGIAEMHDRYGLTNAPTTARGVQLLINDGLTEVHRVLTRRGMAVVKMQDYISSGSLWMGTHYTLEHALKLGFKVVDRLEHIGNPRPQPKRTLADGSVGLQLHARRNLSTLFVLQKRGA